MSGNSNHQAKPSYLGYIYQGFYALLLLLDAKDDSQVSIETKDDVVLSRPNYDTLFQLKHSTGTPASLTKSNDGFWKTIAIWAQYAGDKDVTALMFVTAATVSQSDILRQLENKFCGDAELEKVIQELESEAQRVIDERGAVKGKERRPHKKKYKGCEAFLELSQHKRRSLIKKTIILSQSTTIVDIEEAVFNKLCLIPSHLRLVITRRLLEWWSIRVIRSLYKKTEEVICLSEVQDKVCELIQECREDSLSNEFKDKEPDDLNIYRDSFMEKQILAVKGGSARVNRATKARWKAMNQRNAWLTTDISLTAKVNAFDQRLISEWEDEFEVMKEDCESLEDDGKCNKGLNLLDWSHEKAPKTVSPIVERWNGEFLVRGSYQELANKGKVGWHPDFKEIIKEA